LPLYQESGRWEPIYFDIIYVDDGGIIGSPDAIKEVISALGKVFKEKTISEMEKFVGCHIIDTIDKDLVWIHQPKLLKNLKENLRRYKEDLHASLSYKDTHHPP
jgi:hypothetical protein